jgi:3',5'-cyclic AMP phosphodiesterase CpdA
MAPSDIESPPARQPWEEPPADGWGSHLGELGMEALALLGAAGAAVGAWQVFSLARQFGAQPGRPGPGQTVVVLTWGLVCLLAAALVVFVWRRLGGLALLGAMLTDHGRVARFGGRPPVWLDEPPERGLRVVHLSDLHITEGERVRLAERAAPGGNAVLAALLARPEVARADVLVVTGDVTDRGTAGSWQRFGELIDRAGVKDRVVLVPGNHDLALVDPWGGLRDPHRRWHRRDRFGLVQLANLLKFCEAFADTGGGRLGFVLADGEPVPFRQAWAEAEGAVRPLVTALPTLAVPRQRLGRGFFARRRAVRAYEAPIAEARDRLLALFPMAVPLPERDAVLFVLNSCTPISRHPATNGLGRVGRAQYARLHRLASGFPQPLKLVGLHHHVVRRNEELGRDLVSRIFAKFAVLSDARPLVRFCRRHHVRAVLNGHRHLSYQLRLPNGTVLMAAPSSTLGDELADDPRPQFEHYDFDALVSHPTVGIHHRPVRVRALPG